MNHSRIKYLHLSPDDKFLKYVIENCEAVAPDEHLYIVKKSDGVLNYIQDNKIVVVRKIDTIIELFNQHENTLKMVIIHYLGKDAISFVNTITSDISITWVFWGADGYALPKLAKYKYLDSTRKLLCKINNESYLLNKVKEFAKIHLGAKGRGSELIRAVKRINRCATWVKEDYNLIKPYNQDIKFVYFNNNSIEQLIRNDTDPIERSKISNKYIVLGNSGTPTNNHIEILEILKSDTTLDVVVPLSYGNEKYIKELIKRGKSMLGSRFIPLLKFIPKNEYNFLLENAEGVIMNHLRQQAANNIITALWLGTPVAMNAKSPLYKTLISWGISIDVVDQLEYQNYPAISSDQNLKNRMILDQYLSRSAIQKGYKSLLD